MSKSFKTYQDLLYGFNSSSSVCSLKSGISHFSWTEFLQVTTGKGTKLSLTTFGMPVISVTGKRMLISDYNCVCGHLFLKFHCYPYFKAMLVTYKKTHYGLLLDSLFIFDLKSALILIKLPELHFGVLMVWLLPFYHQFASQMTNSVLSTGYIWISNPHSTDLIKSWRLLVTSFTLFIFNGLLIF